MKSEKSYEDSLGRFVKQQHGLYLKLQFLGIAGLPDRLVLFPGGRIWFGEFKSYMIEPSRLQSYWLKKFNRLGFRTFVINSDESLQQFKVQAIY